MPKGKRLIALAQKATTRGVIYTESGQEKGTALNLLQELAARAIIL